MSSPTPIQPAAFNEIELLQHAQRLLDSCGRGTATSLKPLAGGGNNRVFRVAMENNGTKDAVLLKAYYRHPDDPRDRLAHEFQFSQFAWQHGLRCVPEPLECDEANGLAIYAHIPGRMLNADEVTPERVDEAIAFFMQLNAHRDHEDAQALNTGSESCFSNIEHVALVDQRVRKLDAIGDPAAAAFVERELKPVWASIHPKIAQADDAMEPSPRCLSPSDFGFHNAILNADKRLIFHDFEYAGWDDPAKMLGDFFHQPRRPAPGSCYPAFENAVIEALQLDDAQRSRFRTLLPVYRVKWCSIILAPLLPGAAERRRFAGVEIDPNEIVQRAHSMLHQPLTTDH